jgi:UDP-GlcNAc:undecaprenyl-phosphate/decaprenyl-phosphate GlcNAc-1-phosphate transferase
MKTLFLAIALSALALFALLLIAQRFGLVDQPDARKAHAKAVPAVGGIAWFVGMLALLTALPLPAMRDVLLGMSVLVLIGAIDDQRPLPSSVRLAAQAFAVWLAFQSSGPLLSLGNTFGLELTLQALAWPFTIFAVVGVINAVNMIDGMDGLLGSLALLMLTAMVVLEYRAGFGHMASLPAVAACALLPFLLLNVRTPWQSHARVFFGDAGSMPMGLLLGFCVVQASQGERSVIEPVQALFVLAVPLIDTVSLMLRRLQRRQSPFQADQEHVHHLLQRAGFSISQTLLILLAVASGMMLLGWLCALLGVPAYLQLAAFLSLAVAYHVYVGSALKLRRYLGRDLRDSLSRGGVSRAA